MTRPHQMTPDAEVLIRRMRVAICRLKLDQFHIEEVETYLRHGRVSPEGAIQLLWEGGILDLVLPSDLVKAAA